MRRLGPILVTLNMVTTVPISAQHAALVGVVFDSISGAPLSNAQVDVWDQGVIAVTAPDGRFRLIGVRSGNLTVRIRKPGFKPGWVQTEINLLGAVTFDLGTIPLSPLAVAMDPVLVEDRAIDERLDRVGFYHRRNSEQGTFLTREDIERSKPRLTSELLMQIPAFRPALQGGVGSALNIRGDASILQEHRPCAIGCFVDGVRTEGANVDGILPSSIDAMEMYPGPSTIPLRFVHPSRNPMCGVIVIWTRRAGTERLR